MSRMTLPVTTRDAIDALLSRQSTTRRILGIAGCPGAGKSTVAARVVAAVGGAVLVPMDGFHLAQQVLDATGLAARKGAPETFDRSGYAAMLRRLRDQSSGDPTVYAPAFRRAIEEPIAGAIAVPPECHLVVTEGNYLLHWPEVRALLDEVWWVETRRALRLRRLVARHEAYGKSPADARAWAHGSDERNCELVAYGRGLASVVVAAD